MSLRLRSAFFVLGILLSATSGSAQAPGRFLATPPYNSLTLTGSEDLKFVAGPAYGLIARSTMTKPGDVSRLVRGGVLRVSSGPQLDLVAATAPTLRSAVVNGVGDLEANSITGPTFEGVVHGPGNLTIGSLRVPQARIVNDGTGDLVVRSVNADTLVIEMHGPGDVRVVGAVRNVAISVFGSGDCDARGLSTGDLVVTVAGSGNVQARSARTAQITAAGSGDVVVNGHPKCSVKAAGVGQVVCS